MRSFYLIFLPLLFTLPINAQVEIEQHQWKARVLLFFVPAEEDAEWREQQQIFATDKQGLKERDLVFYKIEAQDELWQKYRVATEQFTAILVGKDGTEKLRQNEPLALARLYATIDAMPMRQREMREQRQ